MHTRLAKLQMARERFWELPALAIAAAIVAAIVMPILDEQITLPDAVAMSGDEDTARAVLGGIVTLAVSVAGVSFSVIAVALVLASQQLSPRVLRSFQRQPLNQAVLAVLLGTATYSLFVLGSVSDARDQPVPELSVTVAMVLAAGALGLFVLFLHHAVRSLNASTVIRRIAAEGQESVALPYPAGAGSQPADGEPAEREADAWQDRVGCVEVRAPRAGYVVSVDGSKIVDWASANDAFVEQRRGLGAFAVTGGVVAVIRCDDAHAVDARSVNDAFMLREERLVDGHVAFPVRQLADIALKGLSPGINDPTTAENAMDSVTDTLVRIARRDELSALRVDDDGVPRLRAIVPTLDALVLLGFDQVRRDAANRPPFAVRLLELLADLREAAGPAHGCGEIDRQAELIAEQAAELAGHQADQHVVAETYARLHRARAVEGVG